MKTFFRDILRDKGNTKFSITKSLALLFALLLVGYLGYYLFFLKIAVDHTLVIELIGLIGALVGLKNNWGVKKTSKIDSDGGMSSTVQIDSQIDAKKNDRFDDAEF